MDKKEEFKLFVKDHPKLLNYIKDGSMSWQKFYEIYDLYGDKEEAWKDYLVPVAIGTAGVASTFGISDVFNWFRGINVDNVQNGINNLQRVIGVFQDLSNKNVPNSTPKSEYKPRPLYKHFDD